MKLHNSIHVYMGSGGVPPDPIHGEIKYTGSRSLCDCEKGEDHGIKYLESKETAPLSKHELAFYLRIKKPKLSAP